MQLSASLVLELNGVSGALPLQSIDLSVTGGAGTTSLKDIVITADMSSASPALFKDTASGTNYSTATLVARNAVGLIYSKVELSNASFTTDGLTSANSTSSSSIETFNLHFSRIDWSYSAAQNPANATRSGYYDSTTAAFSNAGFGDVGVDLAKPLVFQIDKAAMNLTAVNLGGSASYVGISRSYDPSNVTLSASMDESAVGLYFASASRQTFPTAQLLDNSSSGAVAQTSDTWSLTTPRIASEEIHWTPDGGSQTVQVTFDRIDQTFRTVDSSGNVTASIPASIDLRSGLTSGSIVLPASVPGTTYALQLSGFSGELPLNGCSFAVSDSISNFHSGAITTSEVGLTSSLSVASPGVMAAVASGKHYSSAALVSRNSSGDFSVATLTDVVFDSDQLGGTDLTPAGAEYISLRYGAISWSYAVGENVASGKRSGQYDTATTTGGTAAFGDADFDASTTTARYTLTSGTSGLELGNFNWLLSNTASSSGASLNSASFGYFNFSATLSESAPSLFFNTALGKAMPSLVLTERESIAGKSQIVSTWTLSDVLVASASIGYANGVAGQSISLTYSKVSQTYRLYDSSGNATGQTNASFDIQQNKAAIVATPAKSPSSRPLRAPVLAMGSSALQLAGVATEIPLEFVTFSSLLKDLKTAVVTTLSSSLSPALWSAVAMGKRYATAQLITRNSSGNYSVASLSDVLITKYAIDSTAQSGTAVPESLTLQFSSINWDYHYNNDATQGQSTGSYSTATSSGSTGAFGSHSFDPNGSSAVLSSSSGSINIIDYGLKVSRAGSAVPGTFQLTAPLDDSAVALLVSAATGNVLPSLVLSAYTTTGGVKRVSETWSLSNVKVASEQVKFTVSGPVQQFALSFDQIAQSYIPYDSNGNAGTAITASFNFATQLGSGSTPIMPLVVGEVSGNLFLDNNANGISDGDDASYFGTLFLDWNHNNQFDTGEPTTSTGVKGSFFFDELLAGTYTVLPILASGDQLTVPPLAVSLTVSQMFATVPVGVKHRSWFQPSSDAAFSFNGNVLGITAGSITFAGDASATDLLTIDVSGAANVLLTSSQQFDSLNLQDGATVTLSGNGNNVLRTASLTISGGRFDLANNALIVDYSGSTPGSIVRNYLVTGRGGGSFNGSNGITSSSVTGIANTALGFAEASTILGPNGGSFAGQTVDSTALLVRFTYLGDTNLDRKVDIVDLGRLSGNWQSTSANWSQGDLNYDGKVDIVDLGMLSGNWQKSLPTAPAATPPPVVAPPKKGAMTISAASVTPTLVAPPLKNGVAPFVSASKDRDDLLSVLR